MAEKWLVKICDPDGHRERDEVYGEFFSADAAYSWARDNIPSHITWHSHQVLPLAAFNRQEWEARLPDFFPRYPTGEDDYNQDDAP